MKNTMTGTYFYGEESYEFHFATDLSISDKASFVSSVADLVVDDLTKKYNSILRDLITDYFTIKYFTDIDVTIFENSDAFVDDVEQFLEETNVIEIIKATAAPSLFDELNGAIDKSIEYITGIHSNPLGEALVSLVNTLEKKVNEFDMGSMMNMAQLFAGMTEDFNLDNVVNAYMNSDIHKENVDEIAESKKSKKSKKNKKNEIKIDEDLGEVIRAVVEENKAEKAED